jgi:uncharacterized Zn finger protein
MQAGGLVKYTCALSRHLRNHLMLKLLCRICKEEREHSIVRDFQDRMPAELVVAECHGCGVIGVAELPQFKP